MGARNRPGNNRRPAFATGATVVHTSDSAPAPACTHPVGALWAHGLRGRRLQTQARNVRANNRRPAFPVGATVGHTPAFWRQQRRARSLCALRHLRARTLWSASRSGLLNRAGCHPSLAGLIARGGVRRGPRCCSRRCPRHRRQRPVWLLFSLCSMLLPPRMGVALFVDSLTAVDGCALRPDVGDGDDAVDE